MVKITYDLDNKEEAQMIEDYYFMKYHTQLIYYDWRNYYWNETENDEMVIINNQIKMKLNEKVLNTIKSHLNVVELERLYSLCIKYKIYYDSTNILLFLDDLLCYNGRYRLIYRFKYILVDKFGNKKI